ncbi:hypothetical protein ACWKWP_03505 [Agromyces soli]
MTRTTHFTAAAGAVALLALGAGLTGCSVKVGTGEQANAQPATAAAADVSAGCDAAAAIDGVILAELSGEPTDEAFLAVADAYTAAGDALHEGAPEPHEAAHGAAEAITQAVEDGNGPAVFEDPAFTDAATALGAWVFEECDFESVAVTAKSYEFGGLPDTLPAGMVSVQLTNESEDPHVIDVMRIPDDATTVEQIIADPEAAMGSGLVEPAGGGAFTMPGGVGYFSTEFEPGRYLVLCMIPDSENVTHAAHGMYHELVVE